MKKSKIKKILRSIKDPIIVDSKHAVHLGIPIKTYKRKKK